MGTVVMGGIGFQGGGSRHCSHLEAEIGRCLELVRIRACAALRSEQRLLIEKP